MRGPAGPSSFFPPPPLDSHSYMAHRLGGFSSPRHQMYSYQKMFPVSPVSLHLKGNSSIVVSVPPFVKQHLTRRSFYQETHSLRFSLPRCVSVVSAPVHTWIFLLFSCPGSLGKGGFLAAPFTKGANSPWLGQSFFFRMSSLPPPSPLFISFFERDFSNLVRDNLEEFAASRVAVTCGTLSLLS